ncbi:MAG: hypothetical protein Q9165_006870 [Trypethelium subeluteriae]
MSAANETASMSDERQQEDASTLRSHGEENEVKQDESRAPDLLQESSSHNEEKQDESRASGSLQELSSTNASQEEQVEPTIPSEEKEADFVRGDIPDGVIRKKTSETQHNDYDLARRVSTVSIAETLSLPHEIAFVFVICLAQFMTQAGFGQALSILHQIGAAFGLTSPSDLPWLIAAYSLTVGTFILLSGRLGDLFGYKRLLLAGFAWFALWSLVAGLAVYSNHVLFTFARALQGIGPAIVLPNALAILGATYAPGPRKDMVFAVFGATAPGGSVVGGAMAAVLALGWWPWAFFALAIALVATLGLGWWVIPDPPASRSQSRGGSWREKVREMDLVGATLGIAGLVLFNFAWNQAPAVGWQRAYVYVTLILGLLALAAFFYIEFRVARTPLIPFHAFSTDVAFVLGCVAAGWACFGIWVYYIFQYMQVLRGLSPLHSIAWLAPVPVAGAVAAITTGFLLSRIRAAWVMTISMLCFLVGVILIATVPVDQIYWGQTFVCTLIIPFGMDMSFPASTVILSNAVSKKHQGIAASLVATIVNYSISLGLGFAGTVEVQVNNGGLNNADILKGYRGALYMGIGLAALGLGISIVFLVKGYLHDRHNGRRADQEAS